MTQGCKQQKMKYDNRGNVDKMKQKLKCDYLFLVTNGEICQNTKCDNNSIYQKMN